MTFWTRPFFRSIPDSVTSLTVLFQQLDVIIEGVLWAIGKKWECSSWSLLCTDMTYFDYNYTIAFYCDRFYHLCTLLLHTYRSSEGSPLRYSIPQVWIDNSYQANPGNSCNHASFFLQRGTKITGLQVRGTLHCRDLTLHADQIVTMRLT